jgi:hypothetical protein
MSTKRYAWKLSDCQLSISSGKLPIKVYFWHLRSGYFNNSCSCRCEAVVRSLKEALENKQ